MATSVWSWLCFWPRNGWPYVTKTSLLYYTILYNKRIDFGASMLLGENLMHWSLQNASLSAQSDSPRFPRLLPLSLCDLGDSWQKAIGCHVLGWTELSHWRLSSTFWRGTQWVFGVFLRRSTLEALWGGTTTRGVVWRLFFFFNGVKHLLKRWSWMSIGCPAWKEAGASKRNDHRTWRDVPDQKLQVFRINMLSRTCERTWRSMQWDCIEK